jgi:hypothetical protein
MDVRLQVYLRPSNHPDVWILLDADGRTLLTDTLESISRAVLYIQTELALRERQQ